MKGKEEVIGFLINNIIYTGKDALTMVKLTGSYDKIITKDMARLMNCLDLGSTWNQLCDEPILFVIEDEQIRMPTLKENEYKYYVWDENNTVPQERFEHLEC